jgi:hypothetical protein
MKKMIRVILYVLIGVIWFYFLMFIFAAIKDTSRDGWAGDSELTMQDIPSPRIADRD